MGKTLFYTIEGIVWGAIGGGCLFLIRLAFSSDKSINFGLSGMWGIMIICSICGAVIGYFKARQERKKEEAIRVAANSKEAHKQRLKWANEIKQKSLNLQKKCTRNRESVEHVVSTIYKSSDQMSNIMRELSKVAELQGKIDSISQELSKKDGDSL